MLWLLILASPGMLFILPRMLVAPMNPAKERREEELRELVTEGDLVLPTLLVLLFVGAQRSVVLLSLIVVVSMCSNVN